MCDDTIHSSNQNWMIDSHHIFCVFVCVQNSSGPLTTEYLSGFRPHSSYEISVYSFTRVGHGNQFSSPVTFTTNESGKIHTVYTQWT